MGTKIKILHIQDTIASGGVEKLRLSLAKHLDKDKFEQRMICCHAVKNLPDEIRNEGVSIDVIGSFKSPFHWSQHQKVQKIIEEFKPHIIHGAVFEGVTMAAINGWIKKVPIILLEETSDPQNRSWKGDLLMKIYSKLATKVIGVSEGVTEEYLKGKLGLSDKKAITINNGVALPRAVSQTEIEAEKIRWGINEKDFVIGSVGRMKDDSHKKFSDLIKAFSIFAGGKENVKLLMVGGTEEYLKKYRDLADELNVSDKIIFAGFQSDVAVFYKLMNVFALVSAREAFGLVLAEAMLNKLPVIATRVGGMKYIVDNEATGYLVEVGDTNSMCEKFETLYADNDLVKKMGEKGFIKALENYAEEQYIKTISNLYLKLYHK